MEKKSYLPSIGTKAVKPNYYQKKREIKTYSSMYEDEQGKFVITPAPGFTGQSSPMSDSKQPPRNILSQTNSKR